MKIAYISAGAAGMYCGSCLHDNTLARALLRLGHDVALIPTYTPTRTDEENVSINRVFYGAINVYLHQKVKLLRHTPRPLEWLLNRRWLLGLVSRLGGSVDAHDLGALTLSVLRGEHGEQRQELDDLVRWLRDSYRPDVVHLTNAMFLGVTRRIREELAVPVICSLQGEDLFLEELEEPYRSQVRAVLRERARDADGFIAPCEYYARHMSQFLDLPPDRVRVVHLGVDLDGHADVPAPKPQEAPFEVGYLARICPAKGLHVLVDAFRILAEQAGRERVRLRVAGYLGARDRRYFEDQRNKLRSWGLEGSVEYAGEVDREGKLQFLRGLDVLSVPTVYRESKGLFVLEALASGVPVVQPRHGSFPELIEKTGGGVLVEPDSPEALAGALRSLMHDPVRRRHLARDGRKAVHATFHDAAMAKATLEVFGAARRVAA